MNNQALVRRFFAVVVAAVLAVAFAIVGMAPANAAPRGSLDIISVTDTGSGLGGPVQDRPFKVAVRVLDLAGQPMTVNQATTIVLEEVSGPGVLSGTTSAVIPRNGSGETISGAEYSQYANGVVLRVRASSGVDLSPDQVTVDVALTAVGDTATAGKSFNLSDPNCTAPTAAVPNCGRVAFSKGANGPVTLSVGSCDGLGLNGATPCMTEGSVKALVVTVTANFKDSQEKPIYTRTSPAKVVLACDKDLCREISNGVPKLPVLYTLDNSDPLTKKTDPEGCPAKGVVGPDQDACVDYVQSSRNQGDLYLVVLFVHDARFSI